MKKFITSLLFIIVFQNAIISSSDAQTLKQMLEKHVYTIADDSLMGRKAGSEYTNIAAGYIISQFEQIGIPSYKEGTYFQPFAGSYRNIIGVLEGNDPVLKNEYIVVGAHYDHIGFKKDKNKTIIYNGADDNASGVAVLIETARKLKEYQSSLKRSIIFIAFDAEESGLIGSNFFVQNPTVPLDDIKLMLSVDMVGWFKKSGYLKYSGTGTIHNRNNIISDKNLIPQGLKVKTVNFEKSLLTAIDTEGFAKKGIPTLAVTTGLESPYHEPEDEAHLIDYDGMVLVTEHLTNILTAFSNMELLSSSGKLAIKHSDKMRIFSLGISGNAGTNFHHYTAGPFEGKTAPSFSIGLSPQINFNKYLAIRPEVYYEYIQGKHPGGAIKTNNITAPLNFVFQSNGKSEGGIEFFIGGYYSYRFDGKQGAESINFSDDYYRNEAGLNFGIGIRILKLKFSYTNRQAFTDFSRVKNSDNAHIRNHANYFTLTYMLF